MGDILEAMYMTVVSIVSLGFFVWLGGYIIYASNSRWREYEALYAAPDDLGAPLASKLTGAVRISQPGFRWGHLSGDLKSHRHPPVQLGVYPKGLKLSIQPPFRYGCRDLFLPFAQMHVEPAQWDMLSGEYGIRMDGVEGIEMLVFGNILQWAASHSDIVHLMVQRAELVREGQGVSQPAG